MDMFITLFLMWGSAALCEYGAFGTSSPVWPVSVRVILGIVGLLPFVMGCAVIAEEV